LQSGIVRAAARLCACARAVEAHGRVAMELLLLSNSRNERGYLEDYLDAIAALAGKAREAIFVPFARLSQWDEYEQMLADALRPLAIRVASLHRIEDTGAALRDAGLIVVG